MKDSYCPMPFAAAAVWPDGLVRPCCYVGETDLDNDPGRDAMGGIAGAFSSDYMKRLRSWFTAGAVPKGCAGCSHVSDLVPAFPAIRFLELRLTRTCAHRCVMCGDHLSSSHGGKPGVRMSSIPDLAQVASGCAEILLTGGEPFLAPDIMAVLDKVLSGFAGRLVVNTSGTGLTDELADRLSCVRGPARVDVQVSLDGREAVNRAIRGERATGDATAALEKLRVCGVGHSVRCTVSAANAWDMEGFAGEVRRLAGSLVPVRLHALREPSWLGAGLLPEGVLAGAAAVAREAGFLFSPSVFRSSGESSPDDLRRFLAWADDSGLAALPGSPADGPLARGMLSAG